MRRIEEDTYIDDTLVTCAEYQLFIDEMREQGQYFQPDHWTSYQFPKGQARKPILGVRYSDALVFCKWLTKRERGEWNYRIPSHQEAANFPIRPVSQMVLGYWTVNPDEKLRFSWVGPIPDDPRKIDFARARAIAIYNGCDLTRVHIRPRPLDMDLALDNALSISFYDSKDIDRNKARVLDRDRIKALDISRDRALDLAVNLNYDMALDLYVDIFTLQERIAGRSPAFEGIRLVKERIQ